MKTAVILSALMLLATPALAFTMNPQCARIGTSPGRGGISCTCALSLGGFIAPRFGQMHIFSFNIHMDEFEACKTAAARELGVTSVLSP